MPKFEKLFNPPTEGQLTEFERVNKISLPGTYRKFLLGQNGGIPVPNEFKVPDLKESVVLDALYGIAGSEQPGDLGTEYQQVADQLPQGFIPIGHDPGGNQLIMATMGDRSGKVYYWDANHFFKESGESGDTYRIADDIDGLLSSLS